LEIDPIFFLQPLLAIGITLGVSVYWWRRHSFRGVILFLTFGAYALAIALKTVLQDLTAVPVANALGSTGVGFGLYLGLQTVFFEVGLAYLFAVYGVKKWGLKAKDRVPFGLGLAIWENAALLGFYYLAQLTYIYVVLLWNLPSASTVYFQVATNSPGLFYASGQALPLVFYSAMERTSSLMAHTAWGMLTVFAAVTRRKVFLALALPMGLLDALVPLPLSLESYEVGIFMLSLAFLLIAVLATATKTDAPPETAPPQPVPA
jgi:hypothetical protein